MYTVIVVTRYVLAHLVKWDKIQKYPHLKPTKPSSQWKPLFECKQDLPKCPENIYGHEREMRFQKDVLDIAYKIVFPHKFLASIST